MIACFLPLGALSFWEARHHIPADTYWTMASYAIGFGVPAVSVRSPFVRWQALVSAIAFLFVLVKLRGVAVSFVVDGSIGGKLMIVAAVLGLVFSIISIVKPRRG